jgi:hypothetical protein
MDIICQGGIDLGHLHTMQSLTIFDMYQQNQSKISVKHGIIHNIQNGRFY